MANDLTTFERLPQNSDDELVVSSTGLPTISDAPCESAETAMHSLTPDEETGDGWVITEIEP